MEELIQDRLSQDYIYAESLDYRVFGVFLYGSQNYGLSTDTSDIDTICVVIPSIDSIVSARQPLNTTDKSRVYPNGGHLLFKDIRVALNEIKKQNPYIMEIFYTKFYKVNPKYRRWFNELYMTYSISHLNAALFLSNLVAIMVTAEKEIWKPKLTAQEAFKKCGYNYKKLYHILRLEDFITRFCADQSFSTCLDATKSPDFNTIYQAKTGEYDRAHATKLSKQAIEHARALEEQYRFAWNNEGFENDIDAVLRNIIITSLKTEIQE